MKITDIRLGMISVPLRVPFKTALRSVSSVDDVIVEIHTDTGAVGYGEAPPTGIITLGKSDFMRVPRPAPRIMAATLLSFIVQKLLYNFLITYSL